MTVDQLTLVMDQLRLAERGAEFGSPEIRAYRARLADALRRCLAEAKSVCAETDANWDEAMKRVPL